MLKYVPAKIEFLFRERSRKSFIEMFMETSINSVADCFISAFYGWKIYREWDDHVFISEMKQVHWFFGGILVNFDFLINVIDKKFY